MGTLHKLPIAAAPNALRGLYGAPKKRQQARRTPQWFLDAAAEALGGSIPLDPCAHRSPKFHFAEENWCYGGLKKPWERKSFANPPFDDLAAWMRYAWDEATRTGLPQILLGPWRSHRHGFLENLSGGEVVFFRAFPFVGMRNSPPFPCFAVTRHCRLPRTAYEFDRKRW